MLDLAVSIRALQFYSHHAHHIVARIVFNQDHGMLGEIYGKMDGDYDSVIERFIGTQGEQGLDEAQVLMAACKKATSMPMKGVKENKELLSHCLMQVKDINSKIEALCKSGKLSQGTIQMLGNIADTNEVLVYKLQQRLR